MKNTYLHLALVLTLYGCKDATPSSKDFPVIETKEVYNIDSTGATFTCKVLDRGVKPTTSYGFIWGTARQDENEYNSVELGNSIPRGNFEARIDSSLANVTYYVRAYATTNDTRIFGNVVTFNSKGSSRGVWHYISDSLYNNLIEEDHSYPILGTAVINDMSYLFIKVFNYDKLAYINVFNQDNKQCFPLPFYALNPKFPVTDNNQTYFFASPPSWNDSYYYQVIKYDYKNWYRINTIYKYDPYMYLLDLSDESICTSLAINNKVFFVYRSYIFTYDLSTNNIQILNYPENVLHDKNVISAAKLDENIYILTGSKNIWEYDTQTKTYKLVTQYPGNSVYPFVFASHNQYIYIWA